MSTDVPVCTSPETLSKQRYIDYKQEGMRYFFDYIVTDPSLNYLDILFNYHRALRFRVIVEKN